MKCELLVDCHLGFQDLPTLLLSHRFQDTEVCALTACYDPSKPAASYQDLTALQEMASLNADCALGARFPLIPRRSCNGASLPPTADYDQSPENGYAWDLIQRKAAQSQDGITVLLLGPATNLAIALLRYPLLNRQIRHIIMAGGSFGFGDVTSYAERNVFEDAYACKVLLKSGIPMTMIGLSASADAAVSEEDLKEALGPLMKDTLSQYLLEIGNHRLGKTYVLPSLAATAWMLDPAVSKMDHFHVEVETDGTEMYGRTVIEWRHYLHEPEETLVAVSVDREKMLTCLKQAGA